MSEIKKHFHLIFHLNVTIDESKIPTEGVNATTLGTRSGDDAWWRRYDDRQRRLLKAVLADKKTLDNWIMSQFASLFEGGEANSVFYEPDESENILAPAIATLSPEDRKAFADLIAHEVLDDHIEEFRECFLFEFTGLNVAEVEHGGRQ